MYFFLVITSLCFNLNFDFQTNKASKKNFVHLFSRSKTPSEAPCQITRYIKNNVLAFFSCHKQKWCYGCHHFSWQDLLCSPTCPCLAHPDILYTNLPPEDSAPPNAKRNPQCKGCTAQATMKNRTNLHRKATLGTYAVYLTEQLYVQYCTVALCFVKLYSLNDILGKLVCDEVQRPTVKRCRSVIRREPVSILWWGRLSSLRAVIHVIVTDLLHRCPNTK